MAASINKVKFLKDLEVSVNAIKPAYEFGKMMARNIDKVYFVGCGAPNRIMLSAEYWIQHYSKSLESRRYFPAEFIQQNPTRIDEKTLVILGSKSGTTPETVEAAKFCKKLPCISVSVTQSKDKALALNSENTFLLGETDEAHSGMFMVIQALVAGLLKEKDNWILADKLINSLENLPNALIEAQYENEANSDMEARIYHQDRIMYHVASGPMFATAYVHGVCVLMEMQWMHSYPVEAAEFFHGPFEIVDEKMPLVLMLGEDPSRPLMERVLKFCQKYTERIMIYDSKNFTMTGIEKEVRAIVAPYIIQAALNRVSAKLAVWHNHPLSTRRYMWKTEY